MWRVPPQVIAAKQYEKKQGKGFQASKADDKSFVLNLDYRDGGMLTHASGRKQAPPENLATS